MHFYLLVYSITVHLACQLPSKKLSDMPSASKPGWRSKSLTSQTASVRLPDMPSLRVSLHDHP